VPEGWNGVIAPDPDGARYLLLSNFASDRKCLLSSISCELGAPVFSVPTVIEEDKASAEFACEINRSVSEVLRTFIKGDNITAIQASDDSCAVYLQAQKKQTEVTVSIVEDGTMTSATFAFDGCVKVTAEGSTIKVESATFPEKETVNFYEGYTDITADVLTNASFEDDVTYGDVTGNVTLGSTVYNPCYVNAVKSSNSSYANLLPVKGWTAKSTLTGGSHFARMYSMPYSTTMYCVSPSNVGNYAAQCARPLMDDTCGVRCLTVLNSWTSGTNRIVQSSRLPEGEYRLLIDMRYECPNQQSNDGSKIVASGNTNTSYTGVKYGSKTDYRYPTENNTWELMVYDFTLTRTTSVEISLGFTTSAAVGAANNTLLYIDNVRLLQKMSDVDMNICPMEPEVAPKGLYTLTGQKVFEVSADDKLPEHLPAGVYIKGNQKILVK
jgi:uncharacterized protein GlcG (DUF336 family)